MSAWGSVIPIRLGSVHAEHRDPREEHHQPVALRLLEEVATVYGSGMAHADILPFQACHSQTVPANQLVCLLGRRNWCLVGSADILFHVGGAAYTWSNKKRQAKDARVAVQDPRLSKGRHWAR